MRVLEVADLAGQVARVDVAQARLAADLRPPARSIAGVVFAGRSSCSRWWNAVTCHGMSGETPAMNAVSRVSSSLESLKPGIEQRDDLDPEAIAVQPPDRVEDRLQPAAELAVVAVVEALEIDLVEIDLRPQVFEDLRRAVAVRHEAGHEARRSAPP